MTKQTKIRRIGERTTDTPPDWQAIELALCSLDIWAREIPLDHRSGCGILVRQTVEDRLTVLREELGLPR